MTFNEDSRVKIPTILHLTRLGYRYLSLRGLEWDRTSNLVPEVFRQSVGDLNPGVSSAEVSAAFGELNLLLENEDLGKKFYERLTARSGLRLIDFDDFSRNALHVVTEFPCRNEDEEFRPDITLLINGLPLVFIEVKKPNNRDGILAERKRIERRFQNRKFRRFVNATQLMVFSNNMEYDDGSPEPLEGAFYATPSYDSPIFHYFREEEILSLDEILLPEDPATENFVLADNNLVHIRDSPEFATNKSPHSPTNRLSTSLFSPDRLAFLLRYGIAYVRTETSYEKHVMRYPQVFATKAIEAKIDDGTRKGIIWHTQGSGKTALAFYNVSYLTDYFRNKGVIPKFYFIVDRIDLLNQASDEFRSRGLHVHIVDSREEFAAQIKSTVAIHNDSGTPEITVVNIQRFENDPDVIRSSDYAVGLQRIYFLDEVHRSYNPEGSFLANLVQSDPEAIRIGLTGTPLLNGTIRRALPDGENDETGTGREIRFSSRTLFGDYIHKYYYNRSIADGYTLRLIREKIETQYLIRLKEALDAIQIEKETKNRELLYSHEKFVAPMLDYIVEDFERARIIRGDSSIGAMVICDSAAQAREMARIFKEKYAASPAVTTAPVYEALRAAETPALSVVTSRTVTTHALILHDEGTKSERKERVDAFKEGKIDVLFVYNMLLTGFDAARLKKLYLGRVIKAHNLLQALTRVNRPYRSHRYGYVVDFVDIEKEFEKTNKNYFEELQSELGDEFGNYSDLFKTEAEITAEIEGIKDVLFPFDLANAENFSRQISEITDRAEMRTIVKALGDARSLFNLIRLSGQFDLLEKLDFRKLGQLATEANNHLALILQRDALESDDDQVNLLHFALEDVVFTFRKISEGELIIADELRETLRRTREGLGGNFDHGCPVFLSLKEELERLFRKKNLAEITQAEMIENIGTLREIDARARELERKNQLLRAKYANDAKYARLHKRLLEKGDPTANERKLFEALSALKAEADARISQNARILTNEAFATAEMTRLIIEQLKNRHQLPLTSESAQFINSLVMKEYLAEFRGLQPPA
ncbi:MAG: type I restriction endonuclease subunit R [Verrucomicrobiales bacterium]|jgi:type I restriction enzyme R subunit|nr:type I restriction endonuclease subunit R [Verrucomicrobiales bacterium]